MPPAFPTRLTVEKGPEQLDASVHKIDADIQGLEAKTPQVERQLKFAAGPKAPGTEVAHAAFDFVNSR